jgi:hypothetical protein
VDLENILKAIVPLAFLAIWALTAVFNKEENKLPPRASGPPNPYGPRPGIPPRAASTAAERSPTLRWGPQNVASPSPKPGGDEDIVILDAPRTARTIQPRNPPARRTRTKPATSIAAKPATIVPSKIDLGNVTQSVNQQLAMPLMMEPLSAPLTGVGSRPTLSSPATAVDHKAAATVRAISISASLSDPQRLREAILINEVLQPPLALRRRMRRS